MKLQLTGTTGDDGRCTLAEAGGGDVARVTIGATRMKFIGRDSGTGDGLGAGVSGTGTTLMKANPGNVRCGGAACCCVFRGGDGAGRLVCCDGSGGGETFTGRKLNDVKRPGDVGNLVGGGGLDGGSGFWSSGKTPTENWPRPRRRLSQSTSSSS